MANKPQDKPLSEMTDEERRAELERMQAKLEARAQRLEETGFYKWLDSNDPENYGDVWLAGYAKALRDENENRDPKE